MKKSAKKPFTVDELWKLDRLATPALSPDGAQLDGILRAHQRMADGTLRDTCVYSIIASEWPTVKAHLTFRLERPRAGEG